MNDDDDDYGDEIEIGKAERAPGPDTGIEASNLES